MKRYLSLWSICLFQVCFAIAQTKPAVRPLKIGERMPDIALGETYNNHTGKTRFSQFKGKLVILDFWNTNCSTCLMHMPDMDKFQQQFEGKIQIILVNPNETQAEVNERLIKINKSDGSNYRLANLPSIVNGGYLGQLFPWSHGLPHHVWIGPDGKIRVLSVPLALYPEKISSILAGKVVFAMNDDNSSDVFQKKVALNTLLGKYPEAPVLNGSFFTAYNNHYAALGGGRAEDKVDSASGTVRATFVNKEVLELYTNAYQDSLLANEQKVVFSSKTEAGEFAPYVKYQVKDTCRYTFAYQYRKGHEAQADTDFVKSRYCYEQVNPLGFTESQRKEKMLRDLNAFFGQRYHMRATLEKLPVPSYILYRTANDDKLLAKSSTDGYGYEQVVVSGKKMWRSFKNNLKGTLIGILKDGPISGSFTANPFYLLDETGVNGNVDMVLPDPSDVHSLEDFRAAIKPYGLDIRPAVRNLNFLVFTEYH